MFTADCKHGITHANSLLSAVGGFVEREPMGAAHRLVPHPDMAQQVFGERWTTLKAYWSRAVRGRSRLENEDHQGDRAAERCDGDSALVDPSTAAVESLRGRAAHLAESERALWASGREV